MTIAEFLAFYPQFEGAFPEVVTETYVGMANDRFDEFGADMEEARRLYVAHKLTMYARTVPAGSGEGGGSVSLSSLASAGDGAVITSKRVENVAVTYSSGASGSSGASSWLAELNETEFGKQLLALVRLHSFPKYVP